MERRDFTDSLYKEGRFAGAVTSKPYTRRGMMTPMNRMGTS